MKPTKRTILSILFIVGFIAISSSQNSVKLVPLSGYVTDAASQEKLPGVNVYLKGSTTGTITNENGYYSLKVPQGSVIIVFSYIGYHTQEKSVVLKGNLNLNVALELNEEVLPEIKITSQRKFFGNMDYGRDIPSVKAIDIEKINSTNASDILHARIAGVWATKTSGAPGDQQKIRVRGQASFFASAEPLYVIDGVPVPIVNMTSLGIGDLNMHDIESVTVLKDASSTALYGYQGSNGVILIDTKQRSEKKINFSYRTGFQKFDNYYDLMNTKDFIESLDVARQNIKSSIYKYYPQFSDTLCNYDRQDEVFQTGNSQEYQLSGGGEIAKMNYYLSGNYTSHKGVMKGSQQDKYNFTARMGTTIKNKLALNASYRASYQENINNQNEYLGNQIIFEGITKAPCLECTPDSLLYNLAGDNLPTTENLNNRNNIIYNLLKTLDTPQLILERNSQKYNYLSNATSLMARYSISENFKIDIIESAMVRNSDFDTQAPFNLVYYASGYKLQSMGVNVRSEERIALLNHQINLSYYKTFGNHELNVSLANRYYADNIWWEADSLRYHIPPGYFLKNSMVGNGKTGSVIRKMVSYISHISYNYRKKYFISAIANVSRIQEGLHIDYYTLFPSVSLNWDIAREAFFVKSIWMNGLNLYANYGSSGNYPLNGYGNDRYEETLNDHLVISQFANHFLSHESNTELNIGLKSTFLNQRLKLNAAGFSKLIGDQIVMREIPYYYVGGKMFINLGDIEVKGYEVGFEAYIVETNILNWSVNGNISSSSQKVKTLADNQDMQFFSKDLLFPDFIIKEGEPLGDIYGYECFGEYTNEDKLAADKNFINIGGSKYRNIDTTDIILDENDLVVIGNSIPSFNWNLMSSFRYKNFGLDLVVYSVWGMQKFNATRAATFITGVNREANQYYADSSFSIRSYPLYHSSLFIDDASFVRLKTVTLSYEPAKKFLGIHYQFSLSFENFFTYTNYRGYDPEASIYTDNNFSDNAVDRGAYPNPKSVFATIKLSF